MRLDLPARRGVDAVVARGLIGVTLTTVLGPAQALAPAVLATLRQILAELLPEQLTAAQAAELYGEALEITVETPEECRSDEAQQQSPQILLARVTASAGYNLHQNRLGEHQRPVRGDQLGDTVVGGTTRSPIELDPRRGIRQDHAGPVSGISSIA